MKKHVIILLIIMILSAIFLCGCNGENNGGKKSFIGTWKIDTEGLDLNQTLTFKEDKTVIMSDTFNGDIISENFTWEDDGFELCIINFEGDERCGTYEFSNNYNRFTWTVEGGISFTYKRIN